MRTPRALSRRSCQSNQRTLRRDGRPLLPPRKSWIQWRCTTSGLPVRLPGAHERRPLRPLADHRGLHALLPQRGRQQTLVGVPRVGGQQDGAQRPGRPWRLRRRGSARRRRAQARPPHHAPRSMSTAAMRSPACPSQPGGPSPGRFWAPARAASRAGPSVLRRDQPVGAGRERDGPLRVGAQRQAGHVEDRGLLLDAARVGDDGGRAADERQEVDVAERVDDAQVGHRLQAGRRERGAAARVERQDDGQAPRGLAQRAHEGGRGRRACPRWPAGAGSPPVRGGHAQPRHDRLRPQAIQVRQQRVDHGVAHEDDPLAADALRGQVDLALPAPSRRAGR